MGNNICVTSRKLTLWGYFVILSMVLLKTFIVHIDKYAIKLII